MRLDYFTDEQHPSGRGVETPKAGHGRKVQMSDDLARAARHRPAPEHR
jgi:hypothetical protein